MSGVKVAVAQEGFDWSGFYAGIGIGAVGPVGDGEVDATLDGDWLDDNYYPGGDLDLMAALEGSAGFGVELEAGYNVEIDDFLLGVEASIMLGGFSAEGTAETTTIVTYTTTLVDYNIVTTGTETNVTPHTTFSTYTHTVIGDTTIVDGETYAPTEIFSNTTTYANQTFTGGDGTITITPTATSNVSTVSTETNTTPQVTNSPTFSPTDTVGTAVASITGRASIDWLGLIQGRAGFAADRTLFFVSGGLAVGGVTGELSGSVSSYGPDDNGMVTSDDFSYSQSETRVGFVVGGGVEHAIDDHWVVSGEAQYFNLGTTEMEFNEDEVQGTVSETLDGYMIKGGIKYKF